MRVITVMNRKGGVGKTMLCRYIAEYFARFKNLRVLSIDLDSQCNLSSLLLPMDMSQGKPRPPLHPTYDPKDTSWGGRGSAADLYWHGSFLAYDVQFPKPVPGWEILPGDARQLYELEHDDRPVIKEHLQDLLATMLAQLVKDPDTAYDLAVIDTAPSDSRLARSALRAATHALIPFVPEPQSVQGIGQMVASVRDENDHRRQKQQECQLIGIAVNMFRPNLRSQQHVLGGLENHPIYSKYVIPHYIPNRVVFPEMDAQKPVPESVFDITAKEQLPVKEAVVGLCKHIDKKLFGD